jgi:hypothetical protein
MQHEINRGLRSHNRFGSFLRGVTLGPATHQTPIRGTLLVRHIVSAFKGNRGHRRWSVRCRKHAHLSLCTYHALLPPSYRMKRSYVPRILASYIPFLSVHPPFLM